MSFDPQLIKSSFEVAKPIANEVVTKFYEILWRDYPQAKTLFEDKDMAQQKQKLITSLVFIVDNCDNLDKLVPFLEMSGSRHTYYDVKQEHYPMVGDALLKTFAFFFKEKWTPELVKNWTAAYSIISATMIKGSQKSSAA